MNTKRVVIVGAGFAGLEACRQLPWKGVEITLVTPLSYTTMIPALPDVVGGFLPSGALQAPLESVLPPHVLHLETTAQRVDDTTQTVITHAGPISYDYLLLTTGSLTAPATPPPQPYVHYLDTLVDADRIRQAWLSRLETDCAQTARAVVVGGGFTGLEVARALLAAAAHRSRPAEVTVVERAHCLLPFVPPVHRAWTCGQLETAGLRFIAATEVQAFEPEGVVLNSGETIHDALCVLSTGSHTAMINLPTAWPRLSDGRLKVAPTLQTLREPNVFAAGDAAAFPDGAGGYLRKSVNYAFYGGRRAGRNLARSLRGASLKPFRPFDAGWVVPLHNTGLGLIFGRVWLRGRLPLRLHYFMCGYRQQGAIGWPFFKAALVLPCDSCISKELSKGE